MTAIKLLSYIVIIFSCSMIGFSAKFASLSRLKDLENMKSCIQIFENEIRYNISDIIEAAKKIFAVAKGVNIKIFDVLIENDKMKTGIPLSEAWERGVRTAICQSNYSKSDVDAIVKFGNVLGSGDVNTQLKNLEFFCDNIDRCIDECREKNKKNADLYSKVGIYAGIVIVILLI